MATILVKPAEGLKVRDPYSLALIPDDGHPVDDADLYWARALAHGDVVRAEAEGARPAKAKRAGAKPAKAPPQSSPAAADGDA